MFEKFGGNFGTPGSVRFQFDRKGYFAIEKSATTEDKLMEVALEAGADDLQTDAAEGFEIYTQPDSFENVRQALEKAGIPTVEAKLGMIPMNTISVEESQARQVMKLIEALDDHEDIQNVWSNFDIPEELMG
jgi:transcriptional/translational regulatory protein YebC/TACO1